MSIISHVHDFRGTTTQLPSYDPDHTCIGTNIYQYTGPSNLDKFVGPMTLGLARPMEASVAIPGVFPSVIQWDSDTDYIFLADLATAAVTRRIIQYEYKKSTSTFSWRGFITLNWTINTGNKTIKGLRAIRSLHTTGTVALSGTTVTGSGTQFQGERIAVGARIGFGSTDPTQITDWRDISVITNNTALTVSASGSNYSSGTPYVIEEIRIVVCLTNATAANGGLFIAKGLNLNSWSVSGLNVNDAGISTDNIQGVYHLADEATVQNTLSVGLGMDSDASHTSHFVYVLQGTTTAQIFKYDIRSALGSITNGKTTSAFIYKTGVSPTLTGTITASLNNGRIITAKHGPGNNVKSFYFATISRIYRCIESGITNGSTSFLTDAMVEIPPGSVNTYPATGSMNSIDYSDSIDRFIIATTGSSGFRHYVTRYNAVSDPFDHIFLIDSKQVDQSSSDSGSVIHPSINASTFSFWSEGGILYMAKHGATAILNQLYAMPLSTHWSYAAETNQFVITPRFPTVGATSLLKVYVNSARQLGTSTMGAPPEPYRIYVRTAGIDDNTGSWILIDDSGDLSAISPSEEIQFKIEFKSIGTFCIPARIYSIAITYTGEGGTDLHFQPSVGLSSISSKQFAWRLAYAFGGSIPHLRIRLYDAVTNGLVLDDNTDSPTGTFQKTTDLGQNWTSWNNTDKTNETTYLRFTPASFPDNIKVRALLTLL